jgi:hypothetical protein
MGVLETAPRLKTPEFECSDQTYHCAGLLGAGTSQEGRAWLRSGVIRSVGKGVRRHHTHGISRAEGDQTRVSRLRCLAKGAADTHASPLILGPSTLAAIKEAMLDANPGADAVSPSLGMSAPRRSALGRNHD